MIVISVIIGFAIRFMFYSSLVSLLNKIEEENREVSKGVIWVSFFPILWLVAFPYVVSRLSVSLSFELSKSKTNNAPQNPTRTAGICNYVFSLLGQLLITIGIYSNEAIAALGSIFAIVGFIFFVIYWSQISKYNTILDKLNHEEKVKQLGLNDTEEEFYKALTQKIDLLKKDQLNGQLRNEVLNDINNSFNGTQEGSIFLKKYLAVNNSSLIDDLIGTRNYQEDIANDLACFIQNGIIEMSYPHRLIIH